jgi:hypothetical protein
MKSTAIFFVLSMVSFCLYVGFTIRCVRMQYPTFGWGWAFDIGGMCFWAAVTIYFLVKFTAVLVASNKG